MDTIISSGSSIDLFLINLPIRFYQDAELFLEALRPFEDACDQRFMILKIIDCYEAGSVFAPILLHHLFFNLPVDNPSRLTILRLLNSKENKSTNISSQALYEYLTNSLCIKNNFCKSDIEILNMISSFSYGFRMLQEISPMIASCLVKYIRQIIQIDEENHFDISETTLYNAIKIFSTFLKTEYAINIFNFSNDILSNLFKLTFRSDLSFELRGNIGMIYVIISTLKIDCSLSQEKEFDANICANFTYLDDIQGDPHATIAIMYGIITTSALTTLQSEYTDELSLSDYFFNRLIDFFRNSNFNQIEVTRTILALVQRISPVDKTVLEKLMIFCIDNLENAIDNIRNTTKKLFRKLVVCTSTTNFVGENFDFRSSCLESIIKSSVSNNCQYTALNLICEKISCETIIQIVPALPSILIARIYRDRTQAAQIAKTYHSLMQRHYSEMKDREIEWENYWVLTLIDIEIFDNTPVHQYVNLFSEAFKIHNPVIRFLNQRKMNSSYYNRTMLSVIIIAQRNDWKIPPFRNDKTVDIWRGIVGTNILLDLLQINIAEMRVMVLSLLIESRKTTAMFQDFELCSLHEFYIRNARETEPNIRQKIVALYKKAFKRCVDSMEIYKRLHRDYIMIPNNYVDKCVGFMKNLFEYIVLNTFNGESCVSRRLLALDILHCIQMFHFENISYLIQDDILYCYIQGIHAQLCNCYDSVVVASYHLLENIPLHILNKYNRGNDLKTFLNEMFRSAMSISPNSVTTARYSISHAIRADNHSFVNVVEELYGAPIHVDMSENPATALIFYMIKLLSQTVESAVRFMDESDSKSNAEGYVFYGLISCIREVVITHPIRTQPAWSYIIENLTPLLCSKVHDLVAPNIYSDAPEGYLLDFDIHLKDLSTNSQFLMVYSWRSIKEASLLLGVLCQKCPEITSLKTFFKSIGSFFVKIFLEAKHRGAYEQSSVGFAHVVSRFWNSDAEKNRVWLESVLLDVINSIDNEDELGDRNLCVTRRSAGIPFLIQTILAAEPVNRQNESLKIVMNYLTNSVDSSNVNKKIHCMNLLRALMRQYELSERVVPYIEETMITALTSLGDFNWAVRNSATLLFATLTTRLFGVKLSDAVDVHEISRRNQLHYKVFSLRYKNLLHFLIEAIRPMVECPVHGYKPRNTQTESQTCLPLLLILSRLYDCTVESDWAILSKFTNKCLADNNFKIRDLAAITTKNLIPKSLLRLESFVLGDNIEQYRENNYLHGYLLQVDYILDALPEEHSLNNVIYNFVVEFTWIILDVGKRVNFLAATVYLRIIVRLLGRINSVHTRPNWDVIFKILLRNHIKMNASETIQKGLAEDYLVNQFLTLLNIHVNDISFSKDERLQYVNLFLINTVHRNNWKYISVVYNDESHDYQGKHLFILKAFKENIAKITSRAIFKRTLAIAVLEKFGENCFHRNMELYSQFISDSGKPILDGSIISRNLSHFYQAKDEHLVCSLMKLASISVASKDEQEKWNFFNKVEKIYQDGVSTELKLAIFNTSNILFTSITLEKSNLAILIPIWKLLLDMLEDDEEEVRNHAAQFFYAQIKSTSERCIRNFILPNETITILMKSYCDMFPLHTVVSLLLFCVFHKRNYAAISQRSQILFQENSQFLYREESFIASSAINTMIALLQLQMYDTSFFQVILDALKLPLFGNLIDVKFLTNIFQIVVDTLKQDNLVDVVKYIIDYVYDNNLKIEKVFLLSLFKHVNA